MPRIEGIEVAPNFYAPLLTVLLEVDNLTQQMMAMVDSGADRTIIPAEVLDAHPTVSFSDLSPLPTGGVGAGGGFEIRECPGKITWRQWEICDGFQVAEPGKLKMALLGREDFFKRFIVRFVWDKNPPVLEINPPGKSKKKKKK